MKEEFEQWVLSEEYSDPEFIELDRHGNYGNRAVRIQWHVWQSRQPEIDALKEEIEKRKVMFEGMLRVEEILRKENDALRAALEAK